MSDAKALISVVMPCFNEAENVEEAYRRVKGVFAALPLYEYEHIFIDNGSVDDTVQVLKRLASKDPCLKIIVNSRNFGHIRSPVHGYFQAKGDAIVAIVSDLQEPPELIAEFIRKWEEGYKVVVGVRKGSREWGPMFLLRRIYYYLIERFGDLDLIRDFNGFGLYDRRVIDALRKIDDPYPYFRGLICEIGFKRAEVAFIQERRKRGFTKNNFYSLFDNALLGITNHSKVPLRIATICGFVSSIFGFFIAALYFVYKLAYWKSFSVGMAPLLIGLYFWSSVQLFFLGIVGEYVGAIQTQIRKRPVVEAERVNFD